MTSNICLECPTEFEHVAIPHIVVAALTPGIFSCIVNTYSIEGC